MFRLVHLEAQPDDQERLKAHDFRILHHLFHHVENFLPLPTLRPTMDPDDLQLFNYSSVEPFNLSAWPCGPPENYHETSGRFETFPQQAFDFHDHCQPPEITNAGDRRDDGAAALAQHLSPNGFYETPSLDRFDTSLAGLDRFERVSPPPTLQSIESYVDLPPMEASSQHLPGSGLDTASQLLGTQVDAISTQEVEAWMCGMSSDFCFDNSQLVDT